MQARLSEKWSKAGVKKENILCVSPLKLDNKSLKRSYDLLQLEPKNVFFSVCPHNTHHIWRNYYIYIYTLYFYYSCVFCEPQFGPINPDPQRGRKKGRNIQYSFHFYASQHCWSFVPFLFISSNTYNIRVKKLFSKTVSFGLNWAPGKTDSAKPR